MRKPLPSQAELRELLSYDPLTGELRWKARGIEGFATEKAWKIWNTRFVGQRAFIKALPQGHFVGTIWGVYYYAHRIIWKWMTGEDPEVVDHIDGDNQNNRWKNLRDVSQQVNSQNAARGSSNKSGATGVAWDKRAGRWRARIKVGYRDQHLGHFDDFDLAVAARKDAERQYGFHPNHGRAS